MRTASGAHKFITVLVCIIFTAGLKADYLLAQTGEGYKYE